MALACAQKPGLWRTESRCCVPCGSSSVHLGCNIWAEFKDRRGCMSLRVSREALVLAYSVFLAWIPNHEMKTHIQLLMYVHMVYTCICVHTSTHNIGSLHICRDQEGDVCGRT